MTGVPAHTEFFGRTYDEAMGLLLEARNYVIAAELRRQRVLQPTDRLILCCEAMRLTARLTHVMAWLLAQKHGASRLTARRYTCIGLKHHRQSKNRRCLPA